MRTIVAYVGIVLLLTLGACTNNTVSTSVRPPPPPTDATAPTVSLTAPTTSTTYLTTASAVSLTGSASDNVGVTSVTWRNAASSATGNASGTSSWSVASITLMPGVNAITVTARDAAGNAGTFTLAVTYDNTGGTTSLSGSVDSSRINRNGVNMVYLYAGAGVTPDDIGGSGAQPVATAPVTQDNGVCTFSYRFGSIAPGIYTVAFTSQAANDNPGANDNIAFVGTATVTIGAGGGAVQNFLPARAPLQVGSTRTLKKPSAAAAVAQSGDVIEIDAEEYVDDNVVWPTSLTSLTLRGVGGGRAHLRSTALIGNGKGIWVLGANTTVENVEFSGASVVDLNGAGIRADAGGLTVCNGYFHDNENGILGGGGITLIEYSEFGHNGNCLDPSGCAHNMYINRGTKFTLRYSYSHHANQGHLVKSRAQENHILYNRIMDEVDGNASYAIDIPDSGRTFIIGNLLQQGPLSENPAIVAYGAESSLNGTQELYVVNNTFVNDDSGGQFITIRGGTTTIIQNNVFAGPGSAPSASGNLVQPNKSAAGLVNVAGFDYHLTSASPARNAGTSPGVAAGVDLAPVSQYLHPTNRQDRPNDGMIDIGAYEFQ